MLGSAARRTETGTEEIEDTMRRIWHSYSSPSSFVEWRLDEIFIKGVEAMPNPKINSARTSPIIFSVMPKRLHN